MKQYTVNIYNIYIWISSTYIEKQTAPIKIKDLKKLSNLCY